MKEKAPKQLSLTSSYLDYVLQVFLFSQFKNLPNLTRCLALPLAFLSVLFDFLFGITSILEIFSRGVHLLLQTIFRRQNHFAQGLKCLAMSFVALCLIIPINLPMTIVRLFQRTYKLIFYPQNTTYELLKEYSNLKFEHENSTSSESFD